MTDRIRIEGTAAPIEDVVTGLATIRVLLDNFEWDRARAEDPARTAQTIASLIHILMEHYRKPRTSKKPPRGIGYTKDEALIVASLPWHKGIMSAAIRAHYPLADDDMVRVHAKRIRERMAEIESGRTPSPWETSHTWLGDLIAE